MGFKATCHSLRATAELPPSKLSPPPSLSDADRASANFSASLPPPSPAANRSCCCRRCSSPSPSCPPAFPARRRGFFASATLVRTGQEAGGGGATGAGRGAAGAAGAEVRNDAAMRFRAPTGNPSARRASSSSSFSACRGRSRHSCAIVSYLFREARTWLMMCGAQTLASRSGSRGWAHVKRWRDRWPRSGRGGHRNWP